MGKLQQSIRSAEHTVRYNKGDAIAGDQILVECRKPGKPRIIQGSKNHKITQFAVSRNAYAVLTRRYTNVKEGA